MIISTMKEMDTNTTDVRLTYFCRFLVPMVIVMVTVTLRSSSDATSRPFGSGIMMATTSPVPGEDGEDPHDQTVLTFIDSCHFSDCEVKAVCFCRLIIDPVKTSS